MILEKLKNYNSIYEVEMGVFILPPVRDRIIQSTNKKSRIFSDTALHIKLVFSLTAYT